MKFFLNSPTAENPLQLGEGVVIAETAIIHPSKRGSRIILGACTEIYDHVVIRCVGGDGDIVMGQFCYLNPGCVLYSGNGIKMGNYVLLAPGVKVVPANHAFESREIPIRHQGFMKSKGGVVIEDDVWVGANAVLLDGTQIGRGAIIAAGAVVSGCVPAYEIWGGVPAKKIRKRPV
jgi:acetyltransferase-like isoleucine patch superfamily enzyme